MPAPRRFWTSASGCSSLWPTGHARRYLHVSPARYGDRDDGRSSTEGDVGSSSRTARRPSVDARAHAHLDPRESDSAVGFGGGASSRGGPSEPEPLILDDDHEQQHGRQQQQSSRPLQQSNASQRQQSPRQQSAFTISGSAGTGAIPGYGQRKRGHDLPDQSRTSVSERDDEIVRGYEHSVSTCWRP